MSSNKDELAEKANEALASLAMQVDNDSLSTIAERMENIEQTPFVVTNSESSSLKDNPEKDKSVEMPLMAINPKQVEKKDDEVSLAPTGADEEEEAWQNKCWDEIETSKEMRDAKKFMASSDVVIYIIVQIHPGQTIAAKKGNKLRNWPIFISIPNDISGSQLNIGDEVQIIKFTWRPGYEDLVMENAPSGSKGRPWINVGFINAQAVATEMEVINPIHVGQLTGLILDVRRNNKGRENPIRSATVIAQGMRVAQKLPLCQLGNRTVLRAGQPVQLSTVCLSRPSDWKITPQWVLPLTCPFGSAKERKAHQPIVALGIKNHNINYCFPPRSGDSLDDLERMEWVLAAAITACADHVESEIERFTIVLRLEVLPGTSPTGTANVKIRHLIERKEDLVDMTKLWRDDQPVHVQLAAPATKYCGTGYIINTERLEGQIGYILEAYLFPAFQEARNYDAFEDWERIMNGKEAEIEPLQSKRTLIQRATKFAMGEFTMLASEPTGLGVIISVLLAQRSEQAALRVSWDELFVAQNPVLNDLVGDQQQTARLMMDAHPRVVFMQAPPGTGKTKASADIVAAYLREHAEARALIIAPLNVAVAKAVEEMVRTMDRTGWHENILALFSGSGKQKYAQEWRGSVTMSWPQQSVRRSSLNLWMINKRTW